MEAQAPALVVGDDGLGDVEGSGELLLGEALLAAQPGDAGAEALVAGFSLWLPSCGPPGPPPVRDERQP